ncbi:MAG: succinylglutamate desuccinylase/aspartoacylase family protein [Chryseobacterium sp.]|nr:succinylglutamate desuccinylase/aspartoacylase family protein [Chryseobacterium sp.]MBP7499002.1 succinylglutamate desuccinylase/aspartoacylase family protein [Chryseobacterium sp.]
MKFHSLLAVFISLSVSAQNLKLKKILSEKGTVKDTVFTLQTRDKTASVDIPITFIKGEKKGPTFTIIAGIHGMEYPTIMSLLELRKEIDPKKLRGNLIIIPIVNVTSFYKRTPFVNPIDQLNLNRVFPGNPNGTITEVMADFMTKEIFGVTDVLLDMHGGDVGEDLIPFICYYDNKEFTKQTQLAAKLSEVSGFDTVVSYPYILPADKPAMYAFKQAVRQGIPALSIEIGKLGNWEKSELSFTKNAIFRMMSELKMYDKNVTKADPVKIRYNQQAYISVPVQGIFYSHLKAGDSVRKGELIGFINDIFGNKIKEITAPESGVILYKIGTPPVNVGETLLCIGF